MQVSNAVLPSEGEHTGVVVSATETTKDFGNGDEETVEVLFMADYDGEGEMQPIAVQYPPSLSTTNSLGRLIQACGYELVPGQDFDISSIVASRVAFAVVKKDNGFLAIPKASVSGL